MDRGAVDRRERALHRLARASPAYRAAEGYHRMTRPILYHCPDARSLRCLWAAEEAGLAIDLRLLPFPPRAFAPDYRAINPLMTVPGWVERSEEHTSELQSLMRNSYAVFCSQQKTPIHIT